MEKQDIINLFLVKKLQLDSQSLEFFNKNPDEIQNFLENLGRNEVPFTITYEFVQKTLSVRTPNIEIIKKPEHKQIKLSAQGYAQYFSDRFGYISEILTKKLALMNLISVGKISPKNRRFSVIGMIKDKDEDRMEATIEDTTGSLPLKFDERVAVEYKQIVLDEVIGAVCENGENVKVNSLVWPDIPLRKNVAKSGKDISCLFVSDLHMNENSFKKGSYQKFLDWLSKEKKDNFYIFVLGDVSSDKNDVMDFFGSLPAICHKIFLKGETDPDVDAADITIPNPSLIKLDEIYLLLSHGNFMEKYARMWESATPEIVMLNLLKKRHINPVFDSNSRACEVDPFLLDIVPDIFVSGHFHSPALVNYKGATIISNGSFITVPTFWMVNLKTRESIKIDFA